MVYLYILFVIFCFVIFFFFSSRRRHTRSKRDWSSDVCSSDLVQTAGCVDLCVLVGLGFLGASYLSLAKVVRDFTLRQRCHKIDEKGSKIVPLGARRWLTSFGGLYG